MYSSLPFALAQCMVEIPYNFVQVRAAFGWAVGPRGGLLGLACYQLRLSGVSSALCMPCMVLGLLQRQGLHQDS